MRRALLALVAVAAAACGGSIAPVTARPVRPHVALCLATDRSEGVPAIDALPETVAETSRWTARIAGQAVADPGPSPSGCRFTPARTIAFDDAGGHRWWVSFSVLEGNTDVTPAVAPPSGALTFTWVVENSWARFESFSITDAAGLLVAANLGTLLLQAPDAGGLATARGTTLAPLYEGACGRSQDVSVTFSGAGEATLAPGEKALVPLGPGSVDVWNVDGLHWVVADRCSDLFDFNVTLAWRRPAA
jgi:hypothetical protein